MTDIHQKNASNWQYEQLYRVGYKIVIMKKGPELYSRKMLDFITPDLVTTLADTTTSVNERRQLGQAFLKLLRDTWIDHETSMNMVADILMYMDKSCSEVANYPPVFTTTIGMYRDGILKTEVNGMSIMDLLVSVLIDQIEMERTGDIIDRVLIRNCIAILDGLYETDQELRHERFATPSIPGDFTAWVHHTPARLQEESQRCRTAIHSESHDKLVQLVVDELVSKHLEEFLALDTGLRWLVNNDKMEELSILYTLAGPEDTNKEKVVRVLQSHIVELGREIQRVLQATDFSAPAAPAQGEDDKGDEAGGASRSKPAQLTASAQQTAAAIKWVDDVLSLKDKFDKIWSECFQGDLSIQTAITKSFSSFINSFDRSSEYVSLFVDDSLRRGIRDKTEAEVDTILEKAIALIRYLLDMDMFERYYQRHLARRLLHSKSESHEVEKQLILRMKQEFGNQFAFKFEGMLRDLDTSAEFTANYRDQMRTMEEDASKIDISVSILTTNNWPSEVMGRSTQIGSGDVVPCTYPEDIRKLQDSVKQHYLQNRIGRKLTWVGTLGSADIRCTFPPIPGKSGVLARERRYEINVATYGMIVLMLFNDLDDGESLLFEEIQAKTNIPVADLARTLTSLSVVPKCRVLVKDPANKTVKPGDRFKFNNTFASKTIKIKAPTITSVSKVEGEEERKTTTAKADQTRSHLIDAAVVRIMKQRKQLMHTQLITEVLDQLVGRFKPELPMIKRRIEDLIARDYLERVEEASAPTYRYLA
ncbi:unnamed protein product [Parascedosporium putredinis]|uniref:Cullin family profile domain-containing protein n=1 Tax=Parascedosporium putredinis TaxID=1442378 RepID=A0A9P1MAK2_9PEZI|nr:unnamed protein product [Parascedosporium putredinis]CAI7997810.1 unnamed protein product [Parascedosporium putredinis]